MCASVHYQIGRAGFYHLAGSLYCVSLARLTVNSVSHSAFYRPGGKAELISAHH